MVLPTYNGLNMLSIMLNAKRLLGKRKGGGIREVGGGGRREGEREEEEGRI